MSPCPIGIDAPEADTHCNEAAAAALRHQEPVVGNMMSSTKPEVDRLT